MGSLTATELSYSRFNVVSSYLVVDEYGQLEYNDGRT
jgi:hypothetical protein